ncbi:hypothetical protein SAY87_003778 [Trapa incisa]|uniref:Methyltransferase small domain-containing protein n=2 Tax=Trapa TaxID=22665 RepID=A0AAN7QXH9_TRANT|nr:hypothetical protein SAY87_003778 [Trapa incisa]KAK4778758.1 hypothetical protein SAY86_006286 [Trapa natans]
MSPHLLSFSMSYPVFTCRVSAISPPRSSPSCALPPPLSSGSSSALQCPHFEACSGCSHELHLHRPVVVDEATDFFKSMGVSDFTFDSCRVREWRCRAKLAVRGSPLNPLIGLYEEGTHNVVDIPQCKAHHPNINATVEILRRGIKQLNIEPYDEDQGTGDLRYVLMAVTTYNTSLPSSERYINGRVQVSLVWNSRNENSPSAKKLNELALFLWRNGGSKSEVPLIHSVWANFQTSTNNVIFGNRWRLLLGDREFWEHIGGIDISLDPSSFAQANTQAFESLLWKLQKYVPYGASVTDLYAGAGVIGLSLAATRKCRSVKCVEINKDSKQSFEKTVERFPKSVDSSISWHQADASIKPSSWLMGSDVIVVDPPRKGLEPSLIDALQMIALVGRKEKSPSPEGYLNVKEEKRPWILRAREASVHAGKGWTLQSNKELIPEILIYISCGWESFKEDCKALVSSKAWHVQKAHGFNFFPGTGSIEVLAIFKRGPREQLKKKKTEKKRKKRLHDKKSCQ